MSPVREAHRAKSEEPPFPSSPATGSNAFRVCSDDLQDAGGAHHQITDRTLGGTRCPVAPRCSREKCTDPT